MKYPLIILLAAFSAISASAQKHHVYADAGLCGSRINPGLSLTYSYRFVDYVGVGAGFQLYDIFPRIVDVHQYTPALYGDLRFNIRPRKKNQFFLFTDFGVNFYGHTGKTKRIDNIVYTDTDDNGFYTGFGFGYLRSMTSRGGGFYTSLKMISNNSKADAYDLDTQEEYVETSGRGTIVLSFGFKF